METKEYKPPVLFISSAAIEGGVKGLAREFFDEVLHKKFTMPQLEEVAEDKNLRLGDLPFPRIEEQARDLSSFGVFRRYDDNGDEFSPFDVNSHEWKKSYVGLITTKRKIE